MSVGAVLFLWGQALEGPELGRGMKDPGRVTTVGAFGAFVGSGLLQGAEQGPAWLRLALLVVGIALLLIPARKKR